MFKQNNENIIYLYSGIVTFLIRLVLIINFDFRVFKESGYDSDSTLVFKRRENQVQCLSPTEQKTAYKVIQNGGEIPFQGLRKTAPERPKG